MERYFGNDGRADSGNLPPSNAELLARALRGEPIPRIISPEEAAEAARKQLERLAQFSSWHAEELSRIRAAEAEARSERESLEWAAQISSRAEAKLRALQQQEATERAAWRQAEEYVAWLHEIWDSSKHPRGGFSQNRGWWSPAGGSGSAAPGQDSDASGSTTWHPASTTDKLAASGGSGAETAPQALFAAADDAQRAGNAAAASTDWYLPSEDKGTWLGKKGESTFRLKEPVSVNGKLVRDIEFKKGLPALDKFALPGKTARIILTGDSDADIRHAEEAWKQLNPGKKLPERATFHHDLLNVTEHIETIDGKKIKVLVGEMPLVPTEIHQPLHHQGSASAAARYYEGIGNDTKDAIKQLSKKQASVAGTAEDFVARAAKKIRPGKVAKGLLPFVGRTVLKALPLINTGLALLEFSDNVQAHGVGGAIVRATPFLGSVITAHDVGTDLAKQITDDAKASVSAHDREINAPVDQAREEANRQTLDAFHELASKIQVTNLPESGTGQLVDPEEVKDALNLYHGRMMEANQLRIEKKAGFDYNAAATENMDDLKRALEHASQKRAGQACPLI